MTAGKLSTDGRAHVLADGNEIPLLGLGVGQVPHGQETEDSVRWALEAGYRHVDTAQAYGNEESVGRALRDSGVPREEVFITTKFYPAQEDPEAEAQRSLERLGVDQVDLYIIHWPQGGPTWARPGMEGARERGYARSIGVSNFSVDELDVQAMLWWVSGYAPVDIEARAGLENEVNVLFAVSDRLPRAASASIVGVFQPRCRSVGAKPSQSMRMTWSARRVGAGGSGGAEVPASRSRCPRRRCCQVATPWSGRAGGPAPGAAPAPSTRSSRPCRERSAAPRNGDGRAPGPGTEPANGTRASGGDPAGSGRRPRGRQVNVAVVSEVVVAGWRITRAPGPVADSASSGNATTTTAASRRPPRRRGRTVKRNVRSL